MCTVPHRSPLAAIRPLYLMVIGILSFIGWAGLAPGVGSCRRGVGDGLLGEGLRDALDAKKQI